MDRAGPVTRRTSTRRRKLGAAGGLQQQRAHSPPAESPESGHRGEPFIAHALGHGVGDVVLAELGWMAMGVVDTIMVGPLGATALGAVSLGAAANMLIVIARKGLIAQAMDEVDAVLRQQRKEKKEILLGWSRNKQIPCFRSV